MKKEKIKMNDFIKELSGLCCPFDKEVIHKGDPNCDHQMKKEYESDSCVHVECQKCTRKVCFGIWD